MTLMLIDSASLWYRAYYGMPDTLLAPDGTPVNAIKGFLDMSARLIQKYQPNRLIACLDGDWRPSWRVELFPEYKANRIAADGEEEEPDLLTPQIPILLDLLDLLGIPVIGVDDYEADDVIATISAKEAGPTRIVTGDRDLFQLVDSTKDVKIVYLAKGI
jgi:5'-3' exonuclease